MSKAFAELSAKDLRATIDLDSLPFEDTSSLEAMEERVVGQERAIDAIKFGMGMKESGYNIFIAGPPKTGLTYIAKTYLEEQAREEPTPPDWCYVYNFKETDKPKSLKLTAGRGKVLKKDMPGVHQHPADQDSGSFDSDDYRTKESEVHQSFERLRREIIDELSAQAKAEGFILQFPRWVW